MKNDVVLDETKLTEVHTVGPVGRMHIKFEEMKATWASLSSEDKKKKSMLIGGGATLIVLLIVGGVIALGGGKDDPSGQTSGPTIENTNDVNTAEPEEPADQISPLTGERITKTAYEKILDRRVLAVVVENHPDARPQSGLDKADIVFETLVEGGITRFVPIFLSQEPKVVGPVRSLRKYFIDFVSGYGDPVMMHIGYAQTGNPQTNALGELYRVDLHTLGFQADSFWRVSDRVAPHNAYSSTKKLWELADSQGWSGLVDPKLWSFKDPAETIEDPSVTELLVNWQGKDTTWSTKWQYDPVTNMYLRYQQSEPHMDAVSKSQLSARNVVLIYTDQAPSGDDKGRITIDAMGTGKALVFMDGGVVTATWSKPTRTDRYILRTDDGAEVVFNRGRSWIMVVPNVGAEILY